MRKIKKDFWHFWRPSSLLSSLPASSLPYSAAITAEAHSGRTDARGGHRDNKNKSGLEAIITTAAAILPTCIPTGSAPIPVRRQAPAALPPHSFRSRIRRQRTRDQALLDKYQSVLADFDTKQNGYFTLEINQLIYNFIAAGGVSDAFLAGFLTPKKPRSVSVRHSRTVGNRFQNHLYAAV